MWIGVGIAIVLCTAVGVGLDILNEDLPQKQQEGLETIVGLIAVATISYMIIWMTRHSRAIKTELEGEAASALARGSAMALVAMAFLAVLREGFETSVFLLAAFQNSTNSTAAGSGAILGLVGAVAIGLGLYRGGVRINLSRFFKITGLILVFVAAGLLATAAHTAHEAGWINSFQSEAVSLRWLVHPGTVIESLLTGMLGLRPAPTEVEAFVYLAYAVPMALFVLWPRTSRSARKTSTERSVGAAQNPA
jgi:high-affinity iron transporter